VLLHYFATAENMIEDMNRGDGMHGIHTVQNAVESKSVRSVVTQTSALLVTAGASKEGKTYQKSDPGMCMALRCPVIPPFGRNIF